jgi:hypothetical protein
VPYLAALFGFHSELLCAQQPCACLVRIITFALTLCSSFVLIPKMENLDVNAPGRSSESEAEIAASLEAEIDEAIATCGGDVRAALRATLVANAYLEAELERLTEAISTGFARGQMRKPPQRVKIRV